MMNYLLISIFLAFSQEPATAVPENTQVDSQKSAVEQTQTTEPSLISDIIEKYIYNPKGKRDPFKPYVVPKPVEMSTVIQGPILPLQRYSLDQLKLVGIIWGGKKPMAMLIDGTKKVFYVREGDKIGNNQGYVAKIREGEIVVVELLYNEEGGADYITKVMKIQKQK